MKNHFRVLGLLILLLAARGVLAAPAPLSLPPETTAKLRAILNNPVLQDAHIGVSIVALGTAKNSETFPAQPYDDKTQPVIFEADAQKRFLPASNMKLFTAALAVRQLGAGHTFQTRLATNGEIVDGEVRGNLYLIGGGDPSLTTSDLEELADILRVRGIWRVTGDIVGDGSAFKAETFGGRYPDGWTMDDAIWYYGPEISALAINRNQVDVTFTGASQPGQQAAMKIEPGYLPNFSIANHVFTAKPDARLSPLNFDRSNYEDAVSKQLTINGEVASGQIVTEGVAVPAPELWAAAILRQALIVRGTPVRGVARSTPDHVSPRLQDVDEITSPPLRVLLQRLLKNSDNLHAEMLLRAPFPRHDSADISLHFLRVWLKQNHIETANLRFEDGSGLSRYNMLTPRSLAGLLAAIEKLEGGDAIYHALPIAGVDGTLKNRMKSTPAAGNVRAKTGSFSIASNLSGYVTTRDGHRLAVAVMTNFVQKNNDARRVQDEIFAALAGAELSNPTIKQ